MIKDKSVFRDLIITENSDESSYRQMGESSFQSTHSFADSSYEIDNCFK